MSLSEPASDLPPSGLPPAPHPDPARTTPLAGRSRFDRQRFRRYRRMPLISPRLWLRRTSIWAGAITVSIVAIAFAWAADKAGGAFAEMNHISPLSGAESSPLAGLAVSVLLTRTVFPGAQGSGIPQVMAALHMTDPKLINSVLSLRIAVGKVVLTLLGLACGASIGREGPTVQVGASIMNGLAGLLRLPRIESQRALVLAGGAAGIARGVQHAARRDRLRHRGTGAFVRGAHQRHGTNRRRDRRHHHPRSGRQLHVFRRHLGPARHRPRLDRRGDLCGLRRAARRPVRPHADRRHPRAAGPDRARADAPSDCLRGTVRAGDRGTRNRFRWRHLRHRLHPGAQPGRGACRAAADLLRDEVRRHNRVLPQRHPRRHLRAVAGGRRRAGATCWPG